MASKYKEYKKASKSVFMKEYKENAKTRTYLALEGTDSPLLKVQIKWQEGEEKQNGSVAGEWKEGRESKLKS